MAFLGTLIQNFSLLYPSSPEKGTPKKRARAKSCSVQFSASHTCPAFDTSSRMHEGLEGKGQSSNILSCIICRYFVCTSLALVSVDYNEYPSLSSLLWQTHSDPLLWEVFLSLGGQSLSLLLEHHFTCVYILTIADA